jgi:hypothetical protein
MTSAFKVGGRYNWKHQPERLIYKGEFRDPTGLWHQFYKVGDQFKNVWCEVQTYDLRMLEETKGEQQ